MIEILNSQAHLLNEKGKSRADTLHESGVEEHLMERYEDERIHSYRNGQDNKQIGQGTCSDEVIKQTLPDVNSSLMVAI